MSGGGTTDIPVTPEEALLCRDCMGHGQVWSQSLVNPSDRGCWVECERCRGGGYEPTREPVEDEGDE